MTRFAASWSPTETSSAHCYRMLGSVHDADDALQDALLRAWRGLEKFEQRSSLRSWLWITTNACLDVISRRPKRVLPFDHGPAAGPGEGLADPLTESVWIEPYADAQLGIEDGYAAPEARFEQRESVELAFIAALQHLPASQRAVLILRDVLGFSAREAADLLGRTVASVNGALRRGRKAATERLPDRTRRSPCASSATSASAILRSAISTPGSAATSTRSSRCWPRTPRSRCHRSPPGTGAGTRSPPSSLATRSRIGGVCSGARQRAAGIRLLRLGRGAGLRRCRSTCSPWMARWRRGSPHLSPRTAAVRPATGFATDVLERFGLPARLD